MEVNTLSNAGASAVQNTASSVSAPKIETKTSTQSKSMEVTSVDAVSSGMTPKNFVASSSENDSSKNSMNSQAGSTVASTKGVATSSSALSTVSSEQTRESVEEIQASMDKAVQEANVKLADYSKSLKYSVHDATNTVMVKMVDSETDEVIREYPSETRLDAMARARELAGVLVDVRK